MSSPYIDSLIERHVFVEGGIVELPDGTILWTGLGFNNKGSPLREFTFAYSEQKKTKQWLRWVGLDIRQGIVMEVPRTYVRRVEDSNGVVIEDSALVSPGIEEELGGKIEDVFVLTDDEEIAQVFWHDVKSGENDGNNPWLWQSNNMFSPEDRSIKAFNYLSISGTADNIVEIDFVLIQDSDRVEWSETIELRSGDLSSRRIPIERRGNGLQFTVAGRGKAEVRSLGIDYTQTTMYF